MGWRGLATLPLALLAAATGAAQPRSQLVLEQERILVRGDGNELAVATRARVDYGSLGDLVRGIERADGVRVAPLRLSRHAPPQRFDWALCVTPEGTLVIGQRVYTLEAGERRYVFSRGEVVRSYPPLDGRDDWQWLVEVAVGRETNVLLSMQARPHWPVESVRVTAERLR